MLKLDGKELGDIDGGLSKLNDETIIIYKKVIYRW